MARKVEFLVFMEAEDSTEGLVQVATLEKGIQMPRSMLS